MLYVTSRLFPRIRPKHLGILTNTINYFTFLVIGIINNLPYVCITSAAQSISVYFDREQFFGLVGGCNIAAGVLAQFINAVILKPLGVPHLFRVIATCVMAVVGICGLAFSFLVFPEGMHAGFWVTISFVLLSGAATAFGGNVMLGYMANAFATTKNKNQNSDLEQREHEEEEEEDFRIEIETTDSKKKRKNCCRGKKTKKESKQQKREVGEFAVGGFSAGTGTAGIVGTLLYLLLNTFNVNYFVRFIIFLPGVFLYLLLFGFVVIEPRTLKKYFYRKLTLSLTNDKENEEEETLSLTHRRPSLNSEEEERGGGGEMLLLMKSKEQIEDEESLRLLGFVKESNETIESKSKSKCLSKTQLMVLLRRTPYPAINLLLIYWFEYVAALCFGEKIFPAEVSKNSPYWAIHNSFPIFACCYGFGVILSRSSLQLVKIKKLWILTLLQFLMMCFWFTLAYWRYMSTPTLIWLLFPLMFLVGCLGGMSYVNSFYYVVSDEEFSKDEESEKARETAINIVSICTNVGIGLASLTTLLIDNTVF